MSKVERSFTVPDRPELEVAIASGHITVTESPEPVIEVTISGRDRDLAELEIDQVGSVVSVRRRQTGLRSFGGRTDVAVALPPGGEAVLKTASGDVKVAAAVDALEVKVASGDVKVGRVSGLAEIKSAAGDVHIESAGEARIGAASGDIRIDQVHDDVTARTAAGDVSIGRFGGDATLKSAAGDLRVGRLDGDSVKASTMSGDVTLGLPPGLDVDANLRAFSGAIRNDLDASSSDARRRVRISAKTMSGDIILRPADRVA